MVFLLSLGNDWVVRISLRTFFPDTSSDKTNSSTAIRRGKKSPPENGWLEKRIISFFRGKFTLFSGFFLGGFGPTFFLEGLFAYTPWNPCSPRSSRDVMWHLMWWFETFPPSLPVVSGSCDNKLLFGTLSWHRNTKLTGWCIPSGK